MLMKQGFEPVENDINKKTTRCKYQKISEELRAEIIERLCIKKQSLRAVAAQLNVNHSTCKAIAKVYESEGRIGKKKTRNKHVNVINTFTFWMVNQGTPVQFSDAKLVEKTFSFNRSQDIDSFLIENSKQEGIRLAQGILHESRPTQVMVQPQIPSYVQQPMDWNILGRTPLQLYTYQPAYQLRMYPQFFVYNPSTL